MTVRPCLALILAAGEGTRMRSELPKVLHRAGGRTLLGHVLAAVEAAALDDVAVVVGPGVPEVADEARRIAPEAKVFVQHERRGTAHAALTAKHAFAGGGGDVIVLFGDTPLIRPETIASIRDRLIEGAAVVVLAFAARDPAGYGRVLTEGGQVTAIREEKDASPAERAITLCNGGIMAIAGPQATALLEAVTNHNAKGEFYLGDVVGLARSAGLPVGLVEAEEAEVLGINTRTQLAGAEALFQARYRADALAAGVTLVAPDTVFLSHDTRFGRDVLVEPFVVFGSGVEVGDGAVIHSFSHVEQARIGNDASVGPYARLRPGADLGTGVRIGNFVEIKNAVFGAGAKANHLSYVGDASVGAGANIGAGTITCNYDGTAKHRTGIGEDAFVGSNSALVAPVTIGQGAYIASGSVITDDVPDDALAFGRARQVIKPGWAAERRSRDKDGR